MRHYEENLKLTDAFVSPVSAPVHGKERLQQLDILRGFALFGILLINVEDFAAPPTAHWIGWWNTAAAWFMKFAGEGKFRSIYALLFGVGFALQLLRAHDQSLAPRYVRRLLVLLAIGIAHYVLLWDGDVLIYYAITGFALLPFAHCQPQTLLRWVFGFFGIAGLAITILLIVFTFFIEPAQPPKVDPNAPPPLGAKYTSYKEGSYVEVIWQRLINSDEFVVRELTGGPFFLALFLLGLYAGKRDIIQNPGEHLPLLWRVFGWAMAIGLPLNYVFATYTINLRVSPFFISFLYGAAFIIGMPLLAIGYVAGLTLLLQNPLWQKRLRPLAALGRLSLSNYLLQSVLCTTLFYGYGLGWYGKIGPAGQIGLTVLLYTLQLLLSQWWLRWFQFGPIEWLWRSLTYLRPQPLWIISYE